MSLNDPDPRQIALIASSSVRYAVRGGSGLVFLLLVLATGLLSAHLIVSPVEQMQAGMSTTDGEAMTGDEAVARIVGAARPGVAWILSGKETGEEASGGEASNGKAAGAKPPGGNTEEWVRFLLDERPALLSVVFLIMLLSVPFLVATGAFNQFSGDVRSRGLRFQLLHAGRSTIFFGRFLGAALYTVLVMALLIVVIVLYMGLKLHVYGAGPLAGWGFRGIAALAVASLPYVALCSWISAAVDSPFASLSVSSLVIGAPPLVALVGRRAWEPLSYVNYLLPWPVQTYLFHPAPLKSIAAAAACMGYTVLFLFLGHRHFRRRDL